MHVPDPFSQEKAIKEFGAKGDISPEQLEKFKAYTALLIEWNVRINLISEASLEHIWIRHFLDCAQLVPLIPKNEVSIADVGSGAGFPGLVLGILGVKNITLIERDTRKAAFLRTALVKLGIKAEILNLDSTAVPNQSFDVLTARALAELGELLEITEKIRKPSTVCLFLKGKNLDAEIANAQKSWDMEIRRMKSLTDADGTIVRVTNIKRLSDLGAKRLKE
jgi:16S rRNA (guanine527-N7)-methyltransferase